MKDNTIKRVMFRCPKWIHEKMKKEAKKLKRTLAEHIILSTNTDIELAETDIIKECKQMVDGKEYTKKYVVTEKEYKKKD